MRNKDLKSLEIFKKGFKKNEVVIYSIALMLVTAGYLNYTTKLENGTIETYSNAEQNIVAEVNTKSNSKNNENTSKNVNQIEVQKEHDDYIAENTNNKNEYTDDDNIGDAKLVDSKSVIADSSDYFVSTKLQRDTNYADTLSTYTKIIEDSSISEAQKSIAMKEITKINDIKNSLSVCENLLFTKGFKNSVVLVNNESINVIVQIEGGLTKQKVAQIQNIIFREFKCEIENIHISEK